MAKKTTLLHEEEEIVMADFVLPAATAKAPEKQGTKKLKLPRATNTTVTDSGTLTCPLRKTETPNHHVQNTSSKT